MAVDTIGHIYLIYAARVICFEGIYRLATIGTLSVNYTSRAFNLSQQFHNNVTIMSALLGRDFTFLHASSSHVNCTVYFGNLHRSRNYISRYVSILSVYSSRVEFTSKVIHSTEKKIICRLVQLSSFLLHKL